MLTLYTCHAFLQAPRVKFSSTFQVNTYFFTAPPHTTTIPDYVCKAHPTEENYTPTSLLKEMNYSDSSLYGQTLDSILHPESENSSNPNDSLSNIKTPNNQNFTRSGDPVFSKTESDMKAKEGEEDLQEEEEEEESDDLLETLKSSIVTSRVTNRTAMNEDVKAILMASGRAVVAAEASLPVELAEQLKFTSTNETESVATATSDAVPEILSVASVVGEAATVTKIVAPKVSKILKFAIPAIGVWLCGPLLSLIDTSAVGVFSGTVQQAALNPAAAVTDYTALLIVSGIFAALKLLLVSILYEL